MAAGRRPDRRRRAAARTERRFGAGSSRPACAGASWAAPAWCAARRQAARHRGADRMAGRARRPAVPAHRPAEGRRRPRRRRDVDQLRRGAQGAAGAGGRQRRDGRHLRAVRHRLGARRSSRTRARRIRLVVANPLDMQRYTTEFYTLAKSVRAAVKRGETQHRRQLRAAGRARPQQPPARRQRPGRGAGGRLAVAVRLRPARERHPPRAAARHGRDPLSHRRRAAHRLPGAAGA